MIINLYHADIKKVVMIFKWLFKLPEIIYSLKNWKFPAHYPKWYGYIPLRPPLRGLDKDDYDAYAAMRNKGLEQQAGMEKYERERQRFNNNLLFP